MKKIIHLIITTLLIAMLVSALCVSSYAVSNFTTVSQFNGKTYTHNAAYANTEVQDMIDVSDHNGFINWYKIKALGINRAIIRVGCRGYGSAGNMMEDSYFYDNVESAADAGIKVGLYFYSQALTTEEAVAEANFCLKRVSEYDISLPIFYDIEFAEVSTGRLDSAWNKKTLNQKKMTDNAVAFCERIKQAGYQAGIYSSAGFYTYQLDADRLYANGYTLWNAHYVSNASAGSYWTCKNPVYVAWQYGGANVQGVCGDPSAAWIKVKYGDKTGYVRTDLLDFTGATSAVSIIDGVNLREGAGTGYKSLGTIPFATKLSVLSYPKSTQTDVNFYYCANEKIKPSFTLKADMKAIKVAWNAIDNAAYYRIYSYNKETGKYTRLSQQTATSYMMTDLEVDTEYTVIVRAFFASGSGSPYTTADNKSIRTGPKKVSGVTLTGESASSLSLSWQASANTKTYKIYSYAQDGGQYTLLAKTSDTKCTLKGLNAGEYYRILVRPYNAYGAGSVYDAGDTVQMQTLCEAPAFTLKANDSKIVAKWQAVNGARFYRVYEYHEETEKYTKAAETGQCSFEQAQLSPDESRIYLVRAYNGRGAGSAYADTDCKQIRTLARKPQFALSAAESGAVTVSWEAAEGAKSYKVFLYNPTTGKYKTLTQTDALSYTYTASYPGNSYAFLVRALNSDGAGSNYTSEDVQQIKVPMKKASFALSSASKGTLTVKWKAVAGARFYRVYRYDAATGKYKCIRQTGDLKATFTALKSGKTYTVLVRAFSASGVGSPYTAADNKSLRVK